MKIVYIAEKEELQAQIKECILDAIQPLMDQKSTIIEKDRCTLIEAAE
jgi:hypothetical protein